MGGLGVLGCFLKDIKSNSILLVSCDHVIGLSGNIENTSKYEGVYQGEPSNIQKLRKIAQDLVLSPLKDSPLAIARLLPDLSINNELFKTWKIKDIISSYPDFINEKVFKIGILSAIYMRCKVYINQEIAVEYDDMLVVESSSEKPFSQPGDSGTLVVTENGEIVGLIFAGTSSGITYVAPLYPLLQALDLTLLSSE
jgi:hypothetical protein